MNNLIPKFRNLIPEHVGRALMFVRGADGQRGAVVEKILAQGTIGTRRLQLDLVANLLPYITPGGSTVRVLKPFEGGLPP